MATRPSAKREPKTLLGNPILWYLIAFRICNALLIRTFFQPDEYFQSLEPAWQLAFGADSGAWITWEWRERLRSSLHPTLFAGVYYLTHEGAKLFGVNPTGQAEALVAAPKVVQALFAAFTDYCTWMLSKRISPEDRNLHRAALALTVFSPWQWFCSTRTLSNSLETTLTTAALCFWPFEPTFTKPSGLRRFRVALALAALATVLRPTNAIIWVVLAFHTALILVRSRALNLPQAIILEAREALFAGSLVLACSVLADRLYFGLWTFPPARFIHFNVAQSLAVFYGRNRPDYYFTEGLPLFLTTALPFAAIGMWQAIRVVNTSNASTDPRRPSTSTPSGLVAAVIVMVGTLSLISHKEVRFIYPLLPILHVLAAGPLSRFLRPFPYASSLSRRVVLILLVTCNVLFAAYISLVHQRGVVDVTHYLRKEYEMHYQQSGAASFGHDTGHNMSVKFFMPCHSTPWRSHLVYPGISAEALTCEPPIGVPLLDRADYLDEADQFYADPKSWIEQNMQSPSWIEQGHWTDGEAGGGQVWPQYLAFFEQLEPTMRDVLEGTEYRECWRGFNTHWHDDSRRKGDVVVWCFRP